MESQRKVAVILAALLCLSAAAEQALDTKPEESSPEEDLGDLQTAETKDLFYAIKNKVDEILFKPFKRNRAYTPAYREYYPVYTNYGYQDSNYYNYGYGNNNKYSKFMQTILDCFNNGQGYASSSGYSGASYPTKSYFIGGKPVGNLYYSSGGNDASYQSNTGSPSFGATISGSASFGGSSSYSSGNSAGFRPSSTDYSSSQTPPIGYYYSSNYPSYNPQSSYYNTNTVPVQQQQQPIDTPPSYNSQGYVYVNTPSGGEVDYSPKAPPSSFSIGFVVPPSGPASEPAQRPVTQIPNPTTVNPLPSPPPRVEDTPSVPITQRPQYNIPQSQSGYSIYSSDSYRSRPYFYAPIASYEYQSSPSKFNPQANPAFYPYNGFYYVAYPTLGNGYQQGNSGAYFGGSVGLSGGNSGVVFPTSTPVSSHVNCN